MYRTIPILFLTVIGELLLLSFTLTAFGVMMAARIKQMQAVFSHLSISAGGDCGPVPGGYAGTGGRSRWACRPASSR